MIHFSLFSGIGGFDLASEWMGWKNYLSCEINEFGNKILEYYWADAYHHRDIHTLTYETIDIELSRRFGSDWRNDDIILTGGFPCQPYSMAGKRLGKEDERHLFPEMLRIIREVQPKWIVGENVLGIVNWSGGLVFEEVQADLEAQGYEVQSYVLPAVSVNAPHRRDRVWFVAYSNLRGRCGQKGLGEYDLRRSEGKKSNNHLVTTDTGLEQGNDAGTPPDTDRNGRGCICGQESEQSPQAYTKPCDTCRKGVTTNTKYKGLEGQHREWEGCTEHRTDKGIFIGTEDKLNATNSRSIGLRKEINGIGKSRFTNEKGEIGNWQNFPTQSPICGGDDGLPTELDGITFSKWRQQSIMAYGNAVVPQVVYQIFKTIEQYELSQ
jgi:DNA (cytosine-5)-methyltransferase 1